MKKLSDVLNEGLSKEESLAINNAKTLSDLASGTIDGMSARLQLLKNAEDLTSEYATAVANIKDDGSVGPRFTSLLSGSGSAWYFFTDLPEGASDDVETEIASIHPEKTKKDLPAVTATMGNSPAWRLLMQCYAALKELVPMEVELIPAGGDIVAFNNIGAPSGNNILHFKSPNLDETGEPMEFYVGIDDNEVVGVLTSTGKTFTIQDPSTLLNWAGLL